MGRTVPSCLFPPSLYRRVAIRHSEAAALLTATARRPLTVGAAARRVLFCGLEFPMCIKLAQERLPVEMIPPISRDSLFQVHFLG